MRNHDDEMRRRHGRALLILLSVEAVLVAIPLTGLLAGAVPGARHGPLLVHRDASPALFWFAWSAWMALAAGGAWVLLRVWRGTIPPGSTRPD